MPNIPEHNGNANQNDIKISSHPIENGYHQEHKTTNADGDAGVVGEEHLYTLGGNVNQYKHYGNQYGGS
jgi:hypothetical protein